jgi:glycosyltransferase involved in cell wall biosynthesis
MVRVRNEADFLAPAVRSIAPLVDEVVIIDNASTDATPAIIGALRRELPGVRAFTYPGRVARAGSEHLQAVATGGRHRLSTLTSWSMRQCRYPFIVTWDADMLAGPQLTSLWEEWRRGPYLSLFFAGLNAHPDRVHLLGARSDDPATIARPLVRAQAPGWTRKMTGAPGETRLYPRLLARSDDSRFWWCESLRSPFTFGLGPPTTSLASRFKLFSDEPMYLHLKYWKRSPNANHSPDFKAMLQGNLGVGPPMPEEWRELAERYGLLNADADSADEVRAAG